MKDLGYENKPKNALYSRERSLLVKPLTCKFFCVFCFPEWLMKPEALQLNLGTIIILNPSPCFSSFIKGSKYLVQCLQKETTLTGHEGCVSFLVRWFVNFIVKFDGEVKVVVLYNLDICLMNIQVTVKY